MGGIAPGLPPAMLSDKPLRFTDSPQHYTSNTGSNVPTPNPRRKSSSTSNEDTFSSEIARIERIPTGYMGNAPAFPDYGPPVYTVVPPEYYRPPEPGYFVSSDYQYVPLYTRNYYSRKSKILRNYENKILLLS